MQDPSNHTRLEAIVETLRRHGVEFIVIGGQAEYLMGGVRLTYDVDVCYRRRPENYAALANALTELAVTLRGAPPGLPFRPDARTIAAGQNFTFKTSVAPLDILGYVEPIGSFDDLAPRATEYIVGGEAVRVIDLDDLIRVKRHVNRPKDRESLLQLLAIKRIREETAGGAPTP